MENWRAKLSAAGVPVSPMRRLDEVVNDPQCAAREMFPYVIDHDAGQVRVVGSPIKFPKEPAAALSRAPDLGQHTKETLSDWFGMDSVELNDLQAAGVILQGGNVRTQPQQQVF
jgi:CoA:oxalate CoA-transferase